MWFKTILVEGFKVNFKLDSGGDVNILPFNIVKQAGIHNKITPFKNKLEGYGGFPIKTIGNILMKTETEKLGIDQIIFVVVSNNFIPILSLERCAKLKSIERIDSI